MSFFNQCKPYASVSLPGEKGGHLSSRVRHVRYLCTCVS